MKHHLTHHLLAALLSVVFTAEFAAQTTAFTYQGQLTDNGSPAIQRLNQKVEVRGRSAEVSIRKLGAENAELKQELATFKAPVNSLAR